MNALEVELEVLRKQMEAALKLSEDKSLAKNIRRKHRQTCQDTHHKVFYFSIIHLLPRYTPQGLLFQHYSSITEIRTTRSFISALFIYYRDTHHKVFYLSIIHLLPRYTPPRGLLFEHYSSITEIHAATRSFISALFIYYRDTRRHEVFYFSIIHLLPRYTPQYYQDTHRKVFYFSIIHLLPRYTPQGLLF